jgi:hypothetical protein
MARTARTLAAASSTLAGSWKLVSTCDRLMRRRG